MNCGGFLINKQWGDIIFSIIIACPRKLTRSPGGPIGPGGPGSPGVPYMKRKTVMHFLCGKRYLLFPKTFFLKKGSSGGFWTETESQKQAQCQPCGRYLVIKQVPDLTSIDLKIKTRTWNGNNVKDAARLLLCGLTSVHHLRQYKGSLSGNTWQVKGKVTSRTTHCSARKSWLTSIALHPLATLEKAARKQFPGVLQRLSGKGRHESSLRSPSLHKSNVRIFLKGDEYITFGIDAHSLNYKCHIIIFIYNAMG